MDWGAFAGAGVGSCAVVLIGGFVSNLAFKRYCKKKSLLQERDLEIGPPSNEGEKEEVRQKLRDAIESRDPENLRNGIEKAEALDMKEQVVTDARRVLKEEKDAVKKMLKDAVASRDPQGLRTGIAKGEALGMKDSELAEARRVLEEEKAATKQELQQAMEARDIDRLRAAIERGEALGLKPGDLVEPKKLLKELEKEKKKKVKRVKSREEAPVREEVMGREPTDPMEEVPDPPLVLPHEGSRPNSIIPSLRSFGFSLRSIASQMLWVDSCEVTIGCGSITERTEYDERSRAGTEQMVVQEASPNRLPQI
eukprot:s1198_g3.t1